MGEEERDSWFFGLYTGHTCRDFCVFSLPTPSNTKLFGLDYSSIHGDRQLVLSNSLCNLEMLRISENAIRQLYNDSSKNHCFLSRF